MIKLTDLLKENKQGFNLAMARLKGDKKEETRLYKKLISSMVYKDEIETMVKKEMPNAKKAIAKEKADVAAKPKKGSYDDRSGSPKKWNAREYKNWIKSMQGNGGRNHSHDMAQNANHEPGLIDFVKKQIRKDYGDESPLERIQWDIEA